MLPFTADTSYCGHVLIVDDIAVNRVLLRDPLEMQGHIVTEAASGQEALDLVEQKPPDVILLDLMMPGMDGYTACRMLKQNPETAHIPIIIVTSLNERMERLRGVEAGANDFLTKPIDITDAVLRVRNAVYGKYVSDQYRESFHKIKKAEAFRENLVNMVIHDMRQPLMLFQGNLELLTFATKGRLSGPEQRYTDQARQAAEDLAGMITSLLDVHALEEQSFPLDIQPVDIVALMRESTKRCAVLRPDVTVVFVEPGTGITSSCDAGLVERILANLLGNAVKFSRPGGRVEASVQADGNNLVTLQVHDDGPGIPAADRQRIFDKFYQVEGGRKRHSSGIGLTFCKLAVEAHGGKIGVSENVHSGTGIWFSLPAEATAS